VFDNPTLRPADVKIEPRVLSFDIETDGKSERLLAISLYAPGLDEVLIVDGSQRAMPEKATQCANEYAALDAFCERINSLDPDVITGWNIIDFDFTVLEKIASRVRHPLKLGRDVGAIRIRKAVGYFGSGQATIPGRIVLDGIDLLRARLCGWTITRWMPWRARCWAKAKRWPAMSTTASAKSLTITDTISQPSLSMRAPMHGSRIK